MCNAVPAFNSSFACPRSVTGLHGMLCAAHIYICGWDFWGRISGALRYVPLKSDPLSINAGGSKPDDGRDADADGAADARVSAPRGLPLAVLHHTVPEGLALRLHRCFQVRAPACSIVTLHPLTLYSRGRKTQCQKGWRYGYTDASLQGIS